MQKRQKDKMDKFKESVSKDGTVKAKPLSAWEKMKEEKEKKD